MVGCLILHGYTGGPHEVEPLVDYLKKHTDWNLEVPTLPGHGEDLQLIDPDLSYETWLEAAEKSLISLKEMYDTVYIIGFSMGGMIGAYLAAKYKVDKLVLIATARRFISIKQMLLDAGDLIRGVIKKDFNDHYMYLWFKEKRGKVPFRANMEFIKLVKYTRAYLKELHIPVFIAQGQQDGVVPANTTYYLDKEIPTKNKEIVLFDEAKHQLCLGEDKDTLIHMVHQFLRTDKSLV